MHTYRQLCLRYVTLYIHFFLFCIYIKICTKELSFFVFVKMHKKKRKNKHIEYTHFSPFLPPFLSRPAAEGGRARLSAKFHPGNHPAPWGAHFFFSLIFSRVVYISFSLNSSHSVPLPFLPPPVRSREAIQPPLILLPIFFSFLLLPGSGWMRWERLVTERKKVNSGRLDEEGKKVKQKRGRKNKKEKQR